MFMFPLKNLARKGLTFVDMIYPLMAKILGRLTDHPEESLGRPVNL